MRQKHLNSLQIEKRARNYLLKVCKNRDEFFRSTKALRLPFENIEDFVCEFSMIQEEAQVVIYSEQQEHLKKHFLEWAEESYRNIFIILVKNNEKSEMLIHIFKSILEKND